MRSFARYLFGRREIQSGNENHRSRFQRRRQNLFEHRERIVRHGHRRTRQQCWSQLSVSGLLFGTQRQRENLPRYRPVQYRLGVGDVSNRDARYGGAEERSRD